MWNAWSLIGGVFEDLDVGHLLSKGLVPTYGGESTTSEDLSWLERTGKMFNSSAHEVDGARFEDLSRIS